MENNFVIYKEFFINKMNLSVTHTNMEKFFKQIVDRYEQQKQEYENLNFFHKYFIMDNVILSLRLENTKIYYNKAKDVLKNPDTEKYITLCIFLIKIHQYYKQLYIASSSFQNIYNLNFSRPYRNDAIKALEKDKIIIDFDKIELRNDELYTIKNLDVSKFINKK